MLTARIRSRPISRTGADDRALNGRHGVVGRWVTYKQDLWHFSLLP
jgi:hypothetical protein